MKWNDKMGCDLARYILPLETVENSSRIFPGITFKLLRNLKILSKS